MTTFWVARNVLAGIRYGASRTGSRLFNDLDGTVLDGPNLVSGVPEALALLRARDVSGIRPDRVLDSLAGLPDLLGS